MHLVVVTVTNASFAFMENSFDLIGSRYNREILFTKTIYVGQTIKGAYIHTYIIVLTFIPFCSIE